MATKKWLPIVVGIVIFVVLVGAGLVGGMIYMVTRQVKVQQMTEAGSQEEFDRLLGKMAGQKPFIEIGSKDSDDRVVVHRELETKEPGAITTLQVRVWSQSDRKLVQLALPFWLLRLTGNRPIRFNAGSHGDVSLRVTPEEIERRGAGLIMNHTMRGGDRLLVWTE